MKSFSEFFPPPRFLEMPFAGVDVSEDAIRVVQFTRKNGINELKYYGSHALPPGIIKNGEIVDSSELKHHLTEVRLKFGFHFARLSLPEEKAYIFRTAIAPTESTNIRDSIEFQLEENVPLSLSEAIFDYSIIEHKGKDASRHLDAVVVVVPRQYVLDYTDIIRAAGIFPLSLQIVPTAIASSVVRRHEETNTMIIHFYEHKTAITIISAGVVQFTSTVGIGGNSFTTSIEKHFGVSTEEAERIKTGESFVPNKERIELFYSLMNTVSALKDEIQRLFVYWQTFKGRADELGGNIGRIVLCGKEAMILGIDEYLSISLKVPVEVGNFWQNAFSFEEYIPPMSKRESLHYAAAIGLALPNHL
jgi:type IV pilus assembly protein PilM